MVEYDIWVWDPLRWYLIGSGIVFALITGPCIAKSKFWDQRLRFAALLGYQTLTVQLMFRGLGNAYSLYHWLIALLGLLAMLGAVLFLVRGREDSRPLRMADSGDT